MHRYHSLDPRLLQILFLLSFLSVGIFWFDFSIQPTQVLLNFLSGITTHFLITRFFLQRTPTPASGFLNTYLSTYLSTIVTCCGISLLVRSDWLWITPLATAIAITSKFLIRYSPSEHRPHSYHLFNPANFGAVIACCLLPHTWITPSQWSETGAFIFLLIVTGLTVTYRSKIFTQSFLFLFFFSAFIFIRNTYLGYELAVTFHQLSKGSLMIFAFFMISDPLTSPLQWQHKIVHTFFIALLGFIFIFKLQLPNGLLYALFILGPLHLYFNRQHQVRYLWK
jgi:Na+-translocating ferredoxin:NAD+ oxidoreductase RnfD subunit